VTDLMYIHGHEVVDGCFNGDHIQVTACCVGGRRSTATWFDRLRASEKLSKESGILQPIIIARR
jgi:hypothetical protein